MESTFPLSARSRRPGELTARRHRADAADGGGAGADGSDRHGSSSSSGRVGGWGSINNQCGQPYQPLGAPILDFVFPVKRRPHGQGAAAEYAAFGAGGSGSGSGSSRLHRKGGAPWKEAEEKEASGKTDPASEEGSSQQAGPRGASSASASSPPSNSLDVHDPVRDLLAICTARRADVLEGTLAIKERVALSQARVKAVRAGASFEQIDRAGRARMRAEEFQRAGIDAASGSSHAVTAAAAASSVDPALPSSAAAVAPVPFPHDPAVSDDELGSALIQAHFALLAERLSTGELGLHTPPQKLLTLSNRLGGPFPLNFNSNAFTNLAAHPLLAKEALQREQELLARSSGSAPSRLTSAGSASSGAGGARLDAQASPSQPSTARGAPAAAGGSNTARSVESPSHPHPSLHPTHSHAPPSALSFHNLRYTLHQSFGTLAQQREKEAAAAAATARRREEAAARKEKQAQAQAQAQNGAQDGSGVLGRSGPIVPPLSLTPPPPGSASASPTHIFSSASSPRPPSGSASARSARPGRRGRSRTRSGLGSASSGLSAAYEAAAASAATLHAPPASSATNRDVEYTRAVAASKYRREHHNSPTSHWRRLGENVCQRYAQLTSMANMAYFNTEGNLFQRGGAMEQERRRARRDRGDGDADGGSSSARAHRSSAPSGPSSSAGQTPRSIHDGQILRQVANTSWGSFDAPTGSASAAAASASSDSDPNGSSSNRASLTLARCYADFDLAKKDLKERLYESLALQDSQRSRMVHDKFGSFSPGYSSSSPSDASASTSSPAGAERDILAMRGRAERHRHQVAQERRDNYAALYQLVQWINVQNGGNNGEQGEAAYWGAGAGAGAAAPGSASARQSSRPGGGSGSGVDVDPCGGGGGCASGAGLPTLEEVYVVEVLACLADSAVPLLASHRANRVTPPPPGPLAQRTLHQQQQQQGQQQQGQQGQGQGYTAANSRAISVSSTAAPSVLPSRRASVASVASPHAAGGGGGGGGSTARSFAHSASTASTGSTSAAALAAAAAAAAASSSLTPPPALLLVLLSLDPSVFRLKEVRELLERWARITGLGEEVLDAALKMLGVDPRATLFSARSTLKPGLAGANGPGGGGTPGGAGAPGAGGGAAMAGSVAQQGQASMFGESSLSGLLDASTKAAMGMGMGGMLAGVSGASSAGSFGLAAPPPRPLSSVILAPVSLGLWASKKAAERARQAARESVRRVRTVNELTSSSNAATRHALGLGGRHGRTHSNATAPLSPQHQQHQQNMHVTAHSHAHGTAEQQQQQSPMFSAAGGGASLHRHQLPVLSEEGSESAAGSPPQSPPPSYSDRVVPRKHTTGVSQQLPPQEREERTLLAAGKAQRQT